MIGRNSKLLIVTACLLLCNQSEIFGSPEDKVEKSQWLDRTVLYGIAPWYYTRGHNKVPLQEITRRLPQIASLGPDLTIWLLPVFEPSSPGQGYDVKNYKKLWPALGSEADLHALIKKAHDLGMKVILDLPINHASAHHDYVSSVRNSGKSSPYYHYFDHEPRMEIPYSEMSQSKVLDGTHFTYYFWDQLFNFDFRNEPTRDFVLDIARHWIEKFDIDGYRFDASWGISSRWPVRDRGKKGFYQDMAEELRSVKDDLILLAEDKAGYPVHFDEFYGKDHPHVFKENGFDIAYDWNNLDPDWISKWSFQDGESHHDTVFNSEPVNERVQKLKNAISYSLDLPDDPTSKGKVLRYLENNDTVSFSSHHSEKMTEVASALMFFLPHSVPMLFYGQEVGHDRPELWQLPSVDPSLEHIKTANPETFEYYKNLIALRQNLDPLQTGDYCEVQVLNDGGTVFAFVRSEADSRLLILANLGPDQKLGELVISHEGHVQKLFATGEASIKPDMSKTMKFQLSGESLALFRL